MIQIIVHFISGKDLTVICDDCVLTNNSLGGVNSIEFQNPKNINPLFLNINEIEYIYQVLD